MKYFLPDNDFRTYIILICFGVITGTSSCKKSPSEIPCFVPEVVFESPYTDPIIQSSGQFVGFNHRPLVGFTQQGIPPCTWLINSVNDDSAGFYAMNLDGSGYRRVTDFLLLTPSWSPDGKTVAFSLGTNLYSMPMDGITADTATHTQLTTEAGNFFPCWIAGGDSLLYDSNIDAPEGTAFYSIWKMAADGSGKTRISKSNVTGDEREPVMGDDNRIYFVTYAMGQPEIFSMKSDGTDKRQQTFGGTDELRRSPRRSGPWLYYWDTGKIFRTPTDTFNPEAIADALENFTVSEDGKIIYATTSLLPADKQWQTLWMLQTPTGNPIQLTFNY